MPEFKNSIKNIVKRALPKAIVAHIRLGKKQSLFKGKSAKETFTYIKKTNHWGNAESVSGFGSELSNTKHLTVALELFFKNFQINSILDIPCGDFNWMKIVNLNNIRYLGGDIVEEIIEENKQCYARENIDFRVLDITKDRLPQVDVIFCRDCLVHLSYKEIYKAIKNIKKSKSTYLLTTSFTNCEENKNIVTGHWRKLNLQKPPFNFPTPVLTIDEKCMEKEGNYRDKSMCLWEVEKIKTSFALKMYYRFLK